MAGIYIHIPFCKQACHYCNFHFATSLVHKDSLLEALHQEIVMRKDSLRDELVHTIYFGGGTPSLLETAALKSLIDSCRANFTVDPGAEITLEANPDDINELSLAGWKLAGINRLSIGVQSFFEEDLKWMNRAHNADEALQAVQKAKEYFDNITIDLIYGSPGLSNEKWRSNVQKAIELNVPHISCYALTVEPKTPLAKLIRDEKSSDVDPEKQSEQFLLLMEWLEEAGYEHYEVSNYARPGYRSRHNSSYWSTAPGTATKYLGIGPSAHSYNGKERQWNISNNQAYAKSIMEGKIPSEKEVLTPSQELNEYIMTSLRTIEGIRLDVLDSEKANRILVAAQKFISTGHLVYDNNALRLTREGKLLADGIASHLFSE